MRINEIMIGDWVYDEESHTRVRVEAIYKNAMVYLTDDDFRRKAAVRDVTPIPLTKEIAAKNGYTREEPFGESVPRYTLHLKDRNDIHLYFYEDGRFSISGLPFHCGEAQYVHELQQAFKRCGMFDLANSFRV